VPGHLIRRDPVTQVLVERRALLDSDWRSLDFDGSAINLSLSWFRKDSLFDSVVIAARHAPKYLQRDLAVLNRLRSAGIAAAE
jgi:hypothetical protein